MPWYILATWPAYPLNICVLMNLGLNTAAFSQALLFLLVPTGMIVVGIDVGVEAVGRGPTQVPGGGRLLLHEADPHDRFDALETVFPGDHQPDAARRSD